MPTAPFHRHRPPVRQFVLPPVPVPALSGPAHAIWTSGGTDALCIGDVILVTEGAEVPAVVDGRTKHKSSGRVAPALVEGRDVRLRTLRRTLATVVDVGMRKQGRHEPTRTLILDVQWSEAPGRPHVALPVGRSWTLFQMSVNAAHLPKRVERLRGSGPKDRTDETGRRVLMDRLVAVAGDDPVERLRLCVDPVQYADDGGHQTLGRTEATLILQGSRPVRTWMIRQLADPSAIPVARDYDDHQERLMTAMDMVDDYDLADA